MGCIISANEAYKQGAKVTSIASKLPQLPDAVHAIIAQKTGKSAPAIKPHGKKFAALAAAARHHEHARKGLQRGESENKADSSQERPRMSAEPVMDEKKSNDTRNSSPVRSGDIGNMQDRGPGKKLSEMKGKIAAVAHFQAELRKQREREKENADKSNLEEGQKRPQTLPVKKALQKWHRGDHHSSEDVAKKNDSASASIASVTGYHFRRRMYQKALFMQKCVKFSAKNSICSSGSD